jgi:hypothetical protein
MAPGIGKSVREGSDILKSGNKTAFQLACFSTGGPQLYDFTSGTLKQW